MQPDQDVQWVRSRRVAGKAANVMAMQLRSSGFLMGEPIPRRFTGDGEDRSPPLEWDHVPAATQEFALICDDPDAPTSEPWVHWVLYKIPAEVRQLPEGVPGDRRLKTPPGAIQGRNSWTSGQTFGYRGPEPPRGHGTHHYHFNLYALDTQLPERHDIDKQSLLEILQGHILATAELIGIYER